MLNFSPQIEECRGAVARGAVLQRAGESLANQAASEKAEAEKELAEAAERRAAAEEDERQAAALAKQYELHKQDAEVRTSAGTKAQSKGALAAAAYDFLDDAVNNGEIEEDSPIFQELHALADKLREEALALAPVPQPEPAPVVQPEAAQPAPVVQPEAQPAPVVQPEAQPQPAGQ